MKLTLRISPFEKISEKAVQMKKLPLNTPPPVLHVRFVALHSGYSPKLSLRQDIQIMIVVVVCLCIFSFIFLGHVY